MFVVYFQYNFCVFQQITAFLSLPKDGLRRYLVLTQKMTQSSYNFYHIFPHTDMLISHQTNFFDTFTQNDLRENNQSLLQKHHWELQLEPTYFCLQFRWLFTTHKNVFYVTKVIDAGDKRITKKIIFAFKNSPAMQLFTVSMAVVTILQSSWSFFENRAIVVIFQNYFGH